MLAFNALVAWRCFGRLGANSGSDVADPGYTRADRFLITLYRIVWRSVEKGG